MLVRYIVAGATALLSVLLSVSATAQDCGCYSTCGSTSGQAYCIGGSLAACMSNCQLNSKVSKDRAEFGKQLEKDANQAIPAFKAARDKLWNTDPKNSDYLATFKTYQQARERRDELLLMEYTAVGLAGLFGGGIQYQRLDDRYLVPAPAVKAFHAYALKRLDVITGHQDPYDGSHTRYVELADTAEVNTWYSRHGQLPVLLGLDGLPTPPGWVPQGASEDPRFRVCVERGRAAHTDTTEFRWQCKNSDDPTLPPSSEVWPKDPPGTEPPKRDLAAEAAARDALQEYRRQRLRGEVPAHHRPGW